MLFIHINYTSINLTWKSSRAPMSRLVDAPRERDRGRGGREARHQRGAAGQPDWAESSRCPAVCQPRCPGRIWESPRLARAGVCVRSTRGKGGHQKKKNKKGKRALLIYFVCQPRLQLSLRFFFFPKAHTRLSSEETGGDTKSATKIVAGMKYSAVRPLSLSFSPPLVSPLCRYQPRCDVRW